MKTRTVNGETIKLHVNGNIRKRCEHKHRAWESCPHPWHFAFKWKATHHRFPLHRYVTDRPIGTKKEALREATRIKALIMANSWPPPDATPPSPPATPSSITFSELMTVYLARARKHVSQTQRANDQSKVHRLVAVSLSPDERLGDRLLGRITSDDIEAAFESLTLRAGSTRNKYRSLLLGVERWAVKHKYITAPWLTEDSTIKRQQGNARHRRLLPGEEDRLLTAAASNPWLHAFIVTLLELGCRRGELLQLDWADVDLTRAQVTFTASTTKTKRLRHVPMSGRLRGVLAFLRLSRATGLVFGHPVTGERIKDCKKAWGRCCRDATVTDLRLHDLRHEAGSRWHERGVALHYVSNWLGHSNLMTTSIYLNIILEGSHEQMAKFDAQRGQALPDVAQSPGIELRPLSNADPQPVEKSSVH